MTFVPPTPRRKGIPEGQRDRTAPERNHVLESRWAIGVLPFFVWRLLLGPVGVSQKLLAVASHQATECFPILASVSLGLAVLLAVLTSQL